MLSRMKENHTLALVLLSFAWLLIFVGRLIPSTLLVQIVDSINITDVEAGVGLSAMWFFYGVMQYPGGAYSDEKGRKKIIILSLIIFSIASFFTGLNINYLTVIITFSFLGFSTGLLPAPSFIMIAELFGSKKGKALGIHSSIGGFSGIAPMILPFAFLFMGWRNLFFICGFFGLILTYFFSYYVPETLKKPDIKNHKERLKIGITSMFEKETLFIFVINLILTFAWIGILSWFPTYIQQEKHFGPEIAGILFTVVLTGSFIIKPLLGHLSDRVNRLSIMFFLTFLAGISLILLTFSTQFIHLIIVSFLISQTGAFYPIRTASLMDIWKDETAGTKLGLFRSLIVLGGSPISAIIGWSKDIHGFNMILYYLAVGLFITSILIILKMIIDYQKKKK
jgi:MFS family permease